MYAACEHGEVTLVTSNVIQAPKEEYVCRAAKHVELVKWFVAFYPSFRFAEPIFTRIFCRGLVAFRGTLEDFGQFMIQRFPISLTYVDLQNLLNGKRGDALSLLSVDHLMITATDMMELLIETRNTDLLHMLERFNGWYQFPFSSSSEKKILLHFLAPRDKAFLCEFRRIFPQVTWPQRAYNMQKPFFRVCRKDFNHMMFLLEDGLIISNEELELAALCFSDDEEKANRLREKKKK